MLEFVNAKINIGLQIVGKREDGYHNLQTVFYPVGRKAGTAENPEAFCDILEITEKKTGETKRGKTGETGETGETKGGKTGGTGGTGEGCLGMEFRFSGRRVDCPPEKNLVCRAARLFAESTGLEGRWLIHLDKHLPDGAGMGGGSADAAFVLRMLNAVTGAGLVDAELAAMASKLGADCPFFIHNRPMYAEGTGDLFEEIGLDLGGYFLLAVKPAVYISTKEAFAGVTPKPGEFDLREIASLPIEKWRGKVKNDFEESIFPQFPITADIKEKLYRLGALYASLSGSGSTLYGIFVSRDMAEMARNQFKGAANIEGTYLLDL